MKRLLLPAVCLACFLSVAAYAQRRDVTIETHPEATGASCEEHFSVSMDGEEVFHGEEQKILPAGSVSKLHIDSQSNAGIEVQGWEKPDILVKLCKAVAAPDAAAAKERLAAIKMQIEGGNVTVTSDPGHRSWANFLVYVPKGLALELETHNGPLSLRKVSGNIDAHTVNGPLNIKECAGTIVGETKNGPIELSRTSGDVKVHAKNGPIHVELSNEKWEGAGLKAEGQNGPVELLLPASYKSGVEVTSDGRSPFHCAAAACDGAHKDWDDRSRSVRLGSEPVLVHVSTHNGPVSILSAMF